ncbi:cytochrome P450 [Micromonospora sp. WMMD1082]|uniref:cytochrome P450 n=1 Tax=Micromonospora sp. WMMD1082 TaxID=3016104 RepID=UPI0024167CB1|nr:cytochrome P450 [Micromonospora sp. WMMD1082]MDG4792768.1 cytochrome P450 [Micromonospora sp. WMMD1082]
MNSASTEPPDFPMQRTCPFDPPTEYAQLRRQRSIIQVRVPNGQLAWLVTRHRDVRELLTDPRISSDRTHPNFPLTEEVTPQSRRNIAAAGRSLIGLDHPEHGPRRRMLITEFTVRRINDLRPHIQQIVDACVDDLLSRPRPVDLVPVLAEPLPARTLTELLGMPYDDRDLIERAATAMLRRSVSPQERQRTGAEMRAYIDRLVTAKEAEPTEDLLGRLVVTNRRTGLYDHDQMVGLVQVLMVAGFESTVSMIALGVAGLLTGPRPVSDVVATPEATTAAVEEMLRYFSVADALPRIAREDIEIGGVTIRRGDGVLLSFASANWDDEVFPAASTLDLRRGARHHLAFGYGIHQCIGQNLARAELEIVFRTLFTRVPGLRLAVPLAQLPFKRDSNLYGVDALPVTW